MIKHIVIWSMKDGVTAEQKSEMKKRLEGLTAVIAEARVIEVGIDDENGTMSLTSEFDSAEDLAVYQGHPDHVAAGSLIKTLVAGRTACDYVS